MTNFIFEITGATGGLIHFSVAGPNHFTYGKSYNHSCTESLDLEPGYYLVSVSAATSGSFTFNADGYKSISPSVPDTFNNAIHSYDMEV